MEPQLAIANGIYTIGLLSPTLTENVELTLPDSTGTLGQVLSTDGNGVLDWITPTTSSPAGANTQIQFNNSGSFGASGNLTWNGTNLIITSGNTVSDGVSLVDGIYNVELIAPTLTENVQLTLPDSTGTNGQVLTTNGSGVLDWSTPVVVTPAGANTQIQFNNSGSFGATSDMVWDGVDFILNNGSNTARLRANRLNIGGNMSVSSNGTIVSNAGIVGNSFSSSTFISGGSIIYKNVNPNGGGPGVPSNITTTLTSSSSQVPDSIFLTLPATVGTSGQFITTNGSGGLSWTGGVAGSNTQIQYNNNGSFGASSNLTYDGTSLVVGTQVTGNLTTYSTVYTNFNPNGAGPGIPTDVSTTIRASVFQDPEEITLVLPRSVGTDGQVLTTNGSGVLDWETISGIPAGSNTQIQYNNSGSFGASSNLTYDGTNLTVGTSSSGNINTYTTTYRAINPNFSGPGFASSVTTSINVSTSQTQASITLLLPTTAGTNGQFMTTDGSGVLSWTTGVAGSDTQLQFNNGGAFGASANLTYDGTSLDVGSIVINGTSGDITATSFTTVSDERYKENIKPIDDVFDILSELNSYTYNLKDNDNPKKKYGFIAQELEIIEGLEDLVLNDKNGYKSVDYQQIIPILTHAIKELTYEVNTLKNDMENVKNYLRKIKLFE